MPIYNTNLNNKIIKELIKNNYNIDIKKIKKIKNGSANLFKLYSKNKCYVLKEYQKKFTKEHIELEYYLYRHLYKKGIEVPKYIRNTSNKIYVILNENNILTLQHYIKGKNLKFHKGTNSQVMESAIMYTKILKALEDFDEELPLYNSKIFSSENREEINEEYQNLINSTHKKKIKKELTHKLKMLNNLPEISEEVLKKLTIKNTHGDYTVAQFIYDNKKIKVVLDYITAKKMPIVLEIIRSFIYIDKGKKEINIKNLINYINIINKEYKLNKYDLEYMLTLYYIKIVKSTFGYRQYINNEKKKDYLKLGRELYHQATLLEKNYKRITNQILEKVNYE